MYGGGARNRLHRNAPKVGIYTDVFIAVSEPWPVGGHQVLDGAWAAVTRDFGQISFSRAHMPQMLDMDMDMAGPHTQGYGI